MTQGPREARPVLGLCRVFPCSCAQSNAGSDVCLSAQTVVRGMLQVGPRRNCGLSPFQQLRAKYIEEGKWRGWEGFSDLPLAQTCVGMGCDFDIYFWKLL